MKKAILLSAIMLPAVAFAKKQPNIIYILADDMGYGDISAYDANSKIKTENLDRMVSSGMSFTDSHTSSSVSTPTRYSIITGRYNWRSPLQSGVTWSYSAPLIERERLTVAGMLSNEGYNTATIGKWHLGLGWNRFGEGEDDIIFNGVNFSPIDNGFDYSYVMSASLDIPPYIYIRNHEFTAPVKDTIDGQSGLGFYRKGPIAEDFDINTALENFTQESLKYIGEKSKEDKPFFLYFPLTAPHTPILPPEEFQGKSGTTPYGDMVLYVDDIVGRILQAVKDAGIEDNTMIIFTADNGCSPAANIKSLNEVGHYPNSHFRGTKADIFDGGHRTPFIVQWKGTVKEGSTCDKPVSLVSFMGTCADIVGAKLPEDAAEDSYSILPLLKGKKMDVPAIIHHSINGNFAIRKGDWKLSACPNSGGWSYPFMKDVKSKNLPDMQLYNMKTDYKEEESKNLYNEHPEIVKELVEELEYMVNNGSTRKGANNENDVTVKIYK